MEEFLIFNAILMTLNASIYLKTVVLFQTVLLKKEECFTIMIIIPN